MHLLLYGPGRLGGAIASGGDRRRLGLRRPRPAAGRRAANPGPRRRRRGRGVARVRGRRQPGACPGRAATARSSWRPPAGTPTCRGCGRCCSITAPPPSWPRTSRSGRRCSCAWPSTAAGWYARAGAFEPSIVEWHRRGKADRPSGTARAIARRIVAADPRWAGPDAADADAADAGAARPRLEISRHPRRRRPGHPPRDLRRPGRVRRAAAHRPGPHRLRRRRPRCRPLAGPGSRGRPGSTRSTPSWTTSSRSRPSPSPPEPAPPRSRGHLDPKENRR